MLCGFLLAAGGYAVLRARTAPVAADRGSAGRIGDDGEAAWLDAHRAVRDRLAAAGAVDVLLVGDSLAAGWGGEAPGDPWRTAFPGRSAANAGLPGDRTQNVLWRLDHGACDGVRPRAIVLHVGANNVFDAPRAGTEAVAEGIAACVRRLRAMFPDAPLVVVPVLPAFDAASAFRADAVAANDRLRAMGLDADRRVRILDVGDALTAADGSPRAGHYRPDGLHLTNEGYAAVARKLSAALDAALGPAVPK
ncbi:MAG: hypothetical protein HMLKMBBP_02178 [Planctomycetes bacterium]|nr:hypothetical protein [Planctomycetota bacterium]